MPNSHTPLYQWHVDHKARMVPFGGWDMPVQYAGIAAEHRTVRMGAGAFDVSHMGRVDFTGPDALALLESTFTNSIATMRDGQVRYSFACREDGGILDDVLIYRWKNSFAAVVNASNRAKILAWLERHRAGSNVEIRDRTLETTMVAVQGPKAIALCAGMFADDPAQLKYYFAARTRYRGGECTVSRTGYTGEDGFEATVPNTLGLALWEELIARGTMPCGLGARDTLRLEAAMPLYGHELTETNDPLQAGLGWAVKLDKGPFVGRQALRDLAANRAVRPIRIGLEVEGKRAAREGCSILTTDVVPVGTVSSGSFAPWLEKSIAMGYVAPAATAIGTRLLIDARGTMLPATVVQLPFYERPKKTPDVERL